MQTSLFIFKESLLSFRAGAYLSSAVMTGVAAEKVLLLLRDEVHASFGNQTSKDRFDNATCGKPIKQVYEETWKKLDPVHEALAKDLGKEDIKVEVSQIFDLIRKTRNDAGHPTGRQISRDEAYALLLLFPENCKVTYKTMTWLKSNPLP